MLRYRHETTPSVPGKIVRTDYYGNITEDSLVQKPAPRYRNMNDVVVPGFRKRSAAGEIFNNAMSSNQGTYTANDEYFAKVFWVANGATPEQVHSTHRWSGGSLLTTFFQNYVPKFSSAFDTATATAKAAISAQSNVNKTEVDLGNFALEWNKTRALHRDLGNALYKALVEGAEVKVKDSRMRKRAKFDSNGKPMLNRKGMPVYVYLHDKVKVSGTSKSIRTKNIANLYLTVRMGLLPLLSDLEGASKILFDSRAKRFTARGSETLVDSVTEAIPFDDSPVTHLIQMNSQLVWTVRYGILYETTKLGRLAGQLGLTRPLSTAWESLPWSFVADWFVNVGSWLDATQPSGAHKVLSAWKSTTLVTSTIATVASNFNVTNSGKRYDMTWAGQMVKTSTVKTREPWYLTTPPRPQLAEGFNRLRSLDFANLIMQRIKTKIK